MKCNVGKTDQALRVILAMVIAALGIYFKSWWGLMAIVPLVTGLISFCPLYKILGFSTCLNKRVQ